MRHKKTPLLRSDKLETGMFFYSQKSIFICKNCNNRQDKNNYFFTLSNIEVWISRYIKNVGIESNVPSNETLLPVYWYNNALLLKKANPPNIIKYIIVLKFFFIKKPPYAWIRFQFII